jgi:IS1 family transposase
MNKLSIHARAHILNALSEGMGINATARMTGTSKNTVLKLLADVGEACSLYQDRVMNNLKCEKIECDEIWSFVGAKAKNVRENDEAHADYGDCYTFTAIDPVSKLMPCWLVGERSTACTYEFMEDLAARLSNRIQLTTDGWGAYRAAVHNAFGYNVDFAMVNKSYGKDRPGVEAKRRYSPPEYVSCTREVISGNPDKKHISTSLVERANLSMRGWGCAALPA